MVAPRKIYDFCDPQSSSAAPPPAQRSAPASDSQNNCQSHYNSEFFIDGWDAYDRWLDDVRDRMDARDDTPG